MYQAVPQSTENNQTIFDERCDENYEPTQDEIREYASYIGIDPDQEPYLLWLAKEGLMKPLPPGWKPCQDDQGQLYYFNFDTGKSIWDHPCDEIYKRRVTEERRKYLSPGNPLNASSRNTLNQTGKSASTVSDYLLNNDKKQSNAGNVDRKRVGGMHNVGSDSRYVNSDEDDIDEELPNSEDDDEQSSDGFQRNLDFGIDRNLSIRIQRDENENIATAGVAASHSMNTTSNTVDKRNENLRYSDDDDDDNSAMKERKRRAKQAEEAAQKRLSNSMTGQLTKTTSYDDAPNTPREEPTPRKLQARLDQTMNEERLQILEENRQALGKLRAELQSTKEKEERNLREKMRTDLASYEKEIQENLAREKKVLENRRQEELNKVKQAIEKEKEELQNRLQASMKSDLAVLKASIEQQTTQNTQLRALQDKLTRTQQDADEKLRNVENRYKSELDDLHRHYEEAKADLEKMERRLKEKDSLSSTLQRTLDQLRAEKESVERKLQDAEAQLKAIDDGHRKGIAALSRKQAMNANDLHNVGDDDDDDDDVDDDARSISRSNTANQRNGFHKKYDDAERLSDSDSDVIEMQQTIKELRQTQMEYMSLHPSSTMVGNGKKNLLKTATVDISKLSVADVPPVVRNMLTMSRQNGRMYDSYDTIPSTQFIDSARWTNGPMSSFHNNTNTSLMYQTLSRQQPLSSQTNHWSSQPTLVTREAVIKAARKVFAPNVIDQLTANTRSSTY